MKFEVFIPDEFMDAAIELEDPIAFSNKNTSYDDYYYASINTVAKMVVDYFERNYLFEGRLDEPYVRRDKNDQG